MSIKHVSFDDYGLLDFSGIKAAFQDLLTMSDDADVLFIFNTLDTDVVLQVPSKSERLGVIGSKEIYLPANQGFVLDCRSNAKRIPRGVLRVKYSSVGPTVGVISATVVR